MRACPPGSSATAWATSTTPPIRGAAANWSSGRTDSPGWITTSPASLAAGSGPGQVDTAALATLWAAVERAGFPDVPEFRPVPDATLRQLTVQIGETRRTALVDWHIAPALPGYREAFDVLDGVIRQLSSESVPYPSDQPLIVHNIAAI
jgi:hypothetical protein